MARWFVSKQYHPLVGKALTAYGRRLAMTTTAKYMDRFNDPPFSGGLDWTVARFRYAPSRSARLVSFGRHADYFNGGSIRSVVQDNLQSMRSKR